MAKSSSEPNSEEYAKSLDANDPLPSFRSEFHIPTVTDLHRPTLAVPARESPSSPSTYLCGNSLGLQPKRASSVINSFLTQWRTKAVKGHFVEHSDSPVRPFLHIDDHAAELMAPLVGALPSEVAVMGTLTSNLHLLMSSFYRPTPTRHKILLEGKAFPSDHFAIESQIRHHNLDPASSMILAEPRDPAHPLLHTQDILDTITAHAATVALILLPGVQFYTGQVLDIPTITAHARHHGIPIGWDLAHAAGNVPLHLHAWDVDFAAWCTYKYLNCGPGATAAIFVNARYGHVDMAHPDPDERYWPRLTGWWGDEKSDRFKMTNRFVPRAGAKGFQLSNPGALDMAAVVASLQIFNEVGVPRLREKSTRLTGYLERLLDELRSEGTGHDDFTIITPRQQDARGAQLSIRLKEGLLEPVLDYLDERGVVVDERKPDVIRVAPAPLYNTFVDVWNFCRMFRDACQEARRGQKTAVNGETS